ncbi:unnamed protein product [Dibothriocephalus latus]|uniref:CUB domain-containing protein n=1 Tax=Dibothriocephalus latus TaxID=60516 RepID=A0A3P6T9L6_DIBLA|nr:unnamed protein product [Dibothriocephalus latus]
MAQETRAQVIRLTFTEFDLIAEENCKDNSVTVIRRLETYRTIPKIFCGNQLPPTIVSFDELTLVFDVGSSTQPTHFRANYRFEDNECAKNNGGCHHICYKMPGSFTCKCRGGYELYAESKCRRRK